MSPEAVHAFFMFFGCVGGVLLSVIVAALYIARNKPPIMLIDRVQLPSAKALRPNRRVRS